ncbi:NADPH oxidase 5 [Eurytemora carolleeae]|uniref:NADPH oxidase 5 n=1 Tax=Eurytemora carolleeae TaxID=1294199 RepID=UPI000C765E16|nr:NADPH oxidase 5 [Eurytemora carolleeae]|eukprot:XP_023338172.1 NADPH oxidase 5-like [Eurytemora affinis]
MTSKLFVCFRLSRDETDQEFVTLAALLLCGELEIRADTFQAITTKLKVREKLYGLVSAETDGIVTGDQLIERVATARRSAPKSELAGDNLRWLEKVFKRTVGDHGEITLSDFKNIVQSKNPFFVERVFQIFDKDESGSISFQEFLDAMHQFAGQTPDDKIKFLFKVYDIDGDGLVQEAELQHVMRACMDENGMNFDEDSVEELTGALYQDATSSNQNGITFSALKSQISKHEGLLENLTISIDRWLVPPKPKKRQILTNLFNLSRNRHHQFSFTYVRNNAPLFAFYIIFFLVNLGLIISRLVGYRHTKNLDGSRNWALMVARAAGQCLNFCCTFVLVPMLRLSVTKLREKGLNYLLPLDKHVSFHALTGKLIGVYSLIHTVAHLVNLGMNILVDPVGFLLINRVPIPEHWSSNISLSSPPVIALLPPPFLTPGVNLSSSGNLANPNIIDFDHQFFSIPENWTVWSWLLTSTPGIFGLLPGLANPTGVALVIILSIMIICSMKWVRKSGNFEIFYWTHFLYLVFWLLVILHAPNFWKWFIGPCCLFIIEKCLRFYNSLSEKGKSYVTTGVVLPSKVVNLVIKRPPNFSFKPGDYIFLNIPSIAYFEWHPFTISSAPEQADTISLHIRAVGHWTNSLYQHFEKEQARQDGLESPRTRRTRLRETLQTARERARKISSGISGTSTYNLHSRPGAGAWQGGVAGRGRSRTTMSNLYNNNHMKRRETVLQMSGIGGGEMREDEVSTDIKMVARSYRYMRRKPTILSYQPPKESIDERGEDDLCSSNHFILDRIAEKESTDNLYRSGDDSDIDIKNVNKPLHVYIDGPFGAPTSQIFHAQHAVLIGTGIGVTPFASILKSIMHRYWAARNSCPKCSYSWTNDLRSSVMNLRKVDFFWINREQRSFEWFVNLLSQLEIEQAEQGGAMERFLDMHMYITSALQKTDMKAVGLQLALELLHEKSKRDLITGLKTRTIAGRPNWDKVFKQVTETRKGRVTVFFCGPPQLGKVLKLKCDQFGFDYRKENF